MNKNDVVMQVSEKSGIGVDICEKVIKAFGEQSGEALANKLKGVKGDRTDILSGISEKTGFALEECEKVIASFEEVLGGGLSDKLKFFR